MAPANQATGSCYFINVDLIRSIQGRLTGGSSRCKARRIEGGGIRGVAKTPKDFAAAKDWPWIKAIGYTVRITQYDGWESDEVRYYVST